MPQTQIFSQCQVQSPSPLPANLLLNTCQSHPWLRRLPLLIMYATPIRQPPGRTTHPLDPGISGGAATAGSARCANRAGPLAAPSTTDRRRARTEERAPLEQAEANAADRLLTQTSRPEQKDAEPCDHASGAQRVAVVNLSRDQHVRALQEATSRATDAEKSAAKRAYELIRRYEIELGEVHAELEAKKSQTGGCPLTTHGRGERLGQEKNGVPHVSSVVRMRTKSRAGL